MVSVERIKFADHDIQIVGGIANPSGSDLAPNDIASAGSELVTIVRNRGETPMRVSVSFHGTAPELKLPWCVVGTKPPLPDGEAEGKRSPWGIVAPGERMEFRHTTQRALALTKVFLLTMPLTAEPAPVTERRPRAWALCQEHKHVVDGYARAFPPAVETAEKALPYLYAMAEDEALQAIPPSCPACAIGEDRPEDADYACLRAVRCALSPDLVPLDVVLRIVETDLPGPGEAVVRTVDGEHFEIAMCLRDHRENPTPVLRVEAFGSGPARLGKHLRFTFGPIAPYVWKLSPSLNVPGTIRAFVTLLQPLPPGDRP